MCRVVQQLCFGVYSQSGFLHVHYFCSSGSTHRLTNNYNVTYDIAHISEETFYRFQRQYVIPTINALYWKQEKVVLTDMKSRGNFILQLLLS